jgi:hypothetical protein
MGPGINGRNALLMRGQPFQEFRDTGARAIPAGRFGRSGTAEQRLTASNFSRRRAMPRIMASHLGQARKSWLGSRGLFDLLEKGGTRQ